MQSLRRKITKIPPIAVVRSSLMFNPVTSIAAPQAASFADVLIQASSAPQPNDSTYLPQYEATAQTATSPGALQEQAQAAAVPITSWSPYSNNSTDLYIQLDTLLREKSLLIAIA